jgi:hypothetical protein
LGATGAALLPLPALLSRKVEYLEHISPNYRAWREALIQVMMSGNYKLRSAELERPIGGFRRASVHVTDETGIPMTLTWFQPWRGDRIDQ